jgi:hypothetical protein
LLLIRQRYSTGWKKTTLSEVLVTGRTPTTWRLTLPLIKNGRIENKESKIENNASKESKGNAGYRPQGAEEPSVENRLVN